MSGRPMPVVWAVALTLVGAVGGILATAFWPDLEDRGFVLTVSVVAAVLLSIAAYFLWQGNFWGGIAVIALNALNILSCVPGYFDDTGPDSLVIVLTLAIVLSAGAIVAALVPGAREYWKRR